MLFTILEASNHLGIVGSRPFFLLFQSCWQARVYGDMREVGQDKLVKYCHHCESKKKLLSCLTTVNQHSRRCQRCTRRTTTRWKGKVTFGSNIWKILVETASNTGGQSSGCWSHAFHFWSQRCAEVVQGPLVWEAKQGDQTSETKGPCKQYLVSKLVMLMLNFESMWASENS